MNLINIIVGRYDETEVGTNLPIGRYVLDSGSDDDE